MNNDHAPSPEDNQTTATRENQAKNETPSAGGNVREAFEELSKSLQNVLKTGGREVRRSLDEAIPKTREDVAKGIHDIAYAIAYTVAFSNALASEITPDNIKDGFREGAQSGQSAAEKILRQRREKAEREARETPPADEATATVWT